MTDATKPAAVDAQIISRSGGGTIAYHFTPGKSPGVVFLTGLMSDMTGGKALSLEGFCRARGQAFLRFDYFGHGASSGAFTDGTIGGWTEDAVFVLDELTDGPQVLVGSSMGGWIMLLAALERPRRVGGLLGIAAAPDFTEDLIRPGLTGEQKKALEHDGLVRLPSDYGEDPYTITKALLEDGRKHLLLGGEIPLEIPVRLIHGMEDADVPWRTSLRLARMLRSADVEISLVKDGGHRLSEAEDLERLCRTLEALLQRLENPASEPPPEG